MVKQYKPNNHSDYALWSELCFRLYIIFLASISFFCSVYLIVYLSNAIFYIYVHELFGILDFK